MKFWPLAIAAVVTLIVFAIWRRYSLFINQSFSTQAYVDPASVPNPPPDEDAKVTALTNLVRIPQAQISSSYGSQVSPTPLNPVMPEPSYANMGLDTLLPMYINLGPNQY